MASCTAVEECVICQDALSEPCVAQPCGHANYDFVCLAGWLERSQKCPLCRATVAEVRYQKKDASTGEVHEEVYVPSFTGKYNPTSPELAEAPHGEDVPEGQGPTPVGLVLGDYLDPDDPWMHPDQMRHIARDLFGYEEGDDLRREDPNEIWELESNEPRGGDDDDFELDEDEFVEDRRPRLEDADPELARPLSRPQSELDHLIRRRRAYALGLQPLNLGDDDEPGWRALPTPAEFERDPQQVERARLWISRELEALPLPLVNGRRLLTVPFGRAMTLDSLTTACTILSLHVDNFPYLPSAFDVILLYLRDARTACLFVRRLSSWLRGPFGSLDDWDMATEVPFGDSDW